MRTNLPQRLRSAHAWMLGRLTGHPIGVWFDGYTPVVFLLVFAAIALAMRDVSATGSFGLASIALPATFALLVWDLVFATRRGSSLRRNTRR